MFTENLIRPVSALAALIGLALWRSFYERHHLVTEHLVVRSPKLRGRVRQLVFLTDYHENQYAGDAYPGESLVRAIEAVHPEAILIGGDMINCRDRLCRMERTLALLPRLRALAPVYYADGNHEDRLDFSPGNRQRFLRALAEADVRYMEDDSVCIDEDIRLSAARIDWSVYRRKWIMPEVTPAELRRHVGEADSTRFQILMAHSPAVFSGSGDWGADLTLSGHFHGGTIRLPVLGGVMTPQYQFFHPWCGGTFYQGDRVKVAGRGLGTHSINLRLMNMPQLLWITLEPADARGKCAGREIAD